MSQALMNQETTNLSTPNSAQENHGIDQEGLILDEHLCCKACSSANIEMLLDQVADPLQHVKRKFSVYECNSCQIVFTFPVIKNSDLGFLYQGQYFSADGEQLNWAEKIYRFDQYRYDLSLFKDQIEKDARILDYGCGNGTRVRYLLSKGYKNSYGVDKYKKDVDSAADDQRIVKADPLEFRPDEKFDVVTVYHVLEHLPDLMDHLEHIRENLLAPSGLLVIQVPNAKSWQLKYAGASWVALDLPRHFWHFSGKSLSNILEKKNFEVVKVSARNSVFHPACLLSALFNYDVREQWRKANKSARRLQLEFLLLHILSFPIVVMENIFQSSSMLNITAKNSGDKNTKK